MAKQQKTSSTCVMPDKKLHGEISKLCESMTFCGMQPTCIGALRSPGNSGNRYSVFSQPDQKISGDEIFLQEILQGPFQALGKLSDRVGIALAVASSHLESQSTQRPRKQWESSDIRFPQSSTNTNMIMLDRPYVSADFNDKSVDQWSGTSKYTRSFACLGVMLLELLSESPTTLDGDRWRKDLADRVVLPVERCHNAMSVKAPA